MSKHRFSFHRFAPRLRPLGEWLAVRRPRNVLLRISLGLIGVAVLLVLVVLGAVLGSLMLLGGLLLRLFASRGKPQVGGGNVLEGHYRVVGRSMLPRGS